MDQGSTGLCTSTFNDNGNPTLHEWQGVIPLKHKVFLSHNGSQKDFVKQLCVQLESHGFFPFLDNSQCRVLFGERLLSLIFEAIERCEVVDVEVVVLSEEFFTTIWPIVVSALVLLSFVYLYYKGYIDRGGSKDRSSGSLDFRDIYISIVLFQAAYVWIKFRDVSPLPKGAVYQRRGSSKWEPRIKFPGGTSKRLPLGSYNNFAEAKVVYRIAAFYCNKHMHRLGRLNLGGGAYFSIPTFDVDPDLPYMEKVKQVGDQVLKIYAEFEEQKTSRNLSPHVLGQALETSIEEGELLTTPPIQQPPEPLNSGMDLAVQGQGSQPAPIIHNGVDFNNPSSGRHELLEAYKEIDNLKAQVSRKEDKINEGYKEIDNLKAQLSRKEVECNVLKQRHSSSARMLEVLLEQSRPPDFDSDFDISQQD